MGIINFRNDIIAWLDRNKKPVQLYERALTKLPSPLNQL